MVVRKGVRVYLHIKVLNALTSPPLYIGNLLLVDTDGLRGCFSRCIVITLFSLAELKKNLKVRIHKFAIKVHIW